MNSRLMLIVLAQILSLVCWGMYAKHRISRMDFVAERNALLGFNVGVAVMATEGSKAELAKTDALFDLEKNLMKKDKSWNGLEDHIAVGVLALPAGILSAVSILALLFEARNRKKLEYDLDPKQQSSKESVVF